MTRYYAIVMDGVPVGQSYILPPDKAEELAETILKAAASLGGS